MDNNKAEPNRSNEHTINIWQVDEDRLSHMQQKIADSPRILSLSAGKSSCCIFKVPHSFTKTNGRCYQPQIVSIGPFHHGDPRLRMIEEHKWRFLGSLLKRSQGKGLSLENLLTAVQPLEAKARESYSTNINFSTDEFIEILVLDGCFVIELLRKFGGVVAFEADDPLLSLSWIYHVSLTDLVRLENQIPFFILQCLFDLTQMPGEETGHSLSKLTLLSFNNAFQRSDEIFDKYQNLTGLHILDFLRLSFIPEGYEEPNESRYRITYIFHCISKLRQAGIELQRRNEDSFLMIKFRRGVFEMPAITINDFMSVFLLNCVAFEQCYRACSKHFTAYATLLDCLISTAKDVEYLCDRNIIENYFGTDAEIARFVNKMAKNVSFDIDICYLSEVFNEVKLYYMNSWRVHWASFKYTYFSSAALLVLLLTVVQTHFAIMSYVRPPN